MKITEVTSCKETYGNRNFCVAPAMRTHEVIPEQASTRVYANLKHTSPRHPLFLSCHSNLFMPCQTLFLRLLFWRTLPNPNWKLRSVVVLWRVLRCHVSHTRSVLECVVKRCIHPAIQQQSFTHHTSFIFFPAMPYKR